jgi:HEAT repeat protein
MSNRLRLVAPAAALALLAASCGGLPPGAERADRLLARGDFAGAEREADSELARFPKHPSLWRIKIRAALGRSDNRAAVDHYATWRDLRNGDDAGLLRMMAHTVLWQALRVPSPPINVKAIQVIERLELESFADDVNERVLHDDDYVAAAASVAVMRSYPPAPRVAQDLLHSDDVRARRLVVGGVGRKVGAKARADLSDATRDADAGVRRAAVAAIGMLGSNEDTALLTKLAGSDPDGPVRAAALSGLARGERPGAIDVAREALGDDYLGARIAAVTLLGERGGPDADATLLALTQGDDLFVALRAAALVHKRSKQPVLGPLERALGDPAWNVRAAAVNAAAGIAPRDVALELVTRRLLDDRVEVRLAAARALMRYHLGDRVVDVLVDALADGRDDPRIEAAAQLSRMEDPRGLEHLSKLAGASSAATRAAAVRAHLDAGRPSPGLAAALADESLEVRIDAAETILVLAKE